MLKHFKCWLIGYFTALYQFQRINVFDESYGIWEEPAVIYFKILSGHFTRKKEHSVASRD
jgi:hypothetical protein